MPSTRRFQTSHSDLLSHWQLRIEELAAPERLVDRARQSADAPDVEALRHRLSVLKNKTHRLELARGDRRNIALREVYQAWAELVDAWHIATERRSGSPVTPIVGDADRGRR